MEKICRIDGGQRGCAKTAKNQPLALSASDDRDIEKSGQFGGASNPVSDLHPDVPVALTGLCHQGSASVEIAAQWLSKHRDDIPGFAIPFVRERFGLTVLEAIEALKAGHRLRYAKV